MKKIILAAVAASLTVSTAFAAGDTNCTTPLLDRDFSVQISKEYKGVSAQQLFDQAEVVKKVKPVLIKEIKKYTKMLSASDEEYSGVTTVDRIVNEVCGLKSPLWDAMSANQKTLMIGIDGTPNPYMRKTAHDSDVLALKQKLDAANTALTNTNVALANAKAELTVAYTQADQVVVRNANSKIAVLKLQHDKDVAALEAVNAQQTATLNDLTASPHAVGVYNTAKFHGFKTIDFGNGETAICSSGVHLDTAAGDVNLYAVCMVDAGHLNNRDTVRIYEGYSTDNSDRIDFVRLPYVIKTANVINRLKYYHAPASVRKGLRNGPNYQSAIRYSGGNVITSDAKAYINSPVVRKIKTKVQPLEVLVVNKDQNPVLTKEAKVQSKNWWE
jgi:hypothetical protein